MARNQKQMSGKGALVFGLIWTAFSSIFVVVGLVSTYQAVHRSTWPAVDCELTRFEVKSDPKLDPAFQPQVEFTYEWEGQSYQGDKVWVSQKGEDDYEDLGELIEQYRRGDLSRCYVNPDQPGEAVLLAESDDLWGGLVFALFGGGFVAIGIGIMFSSRWMKKQENAPLSSKSSGEEGAPNVILVPFFLLFGLAGLGVLLFVVLPQGMKYQDARGWDETPAVVEWSRVQSHSSDDGTTYSVDIFYRYQYQEKEYKSNTVDIFSGSSSGRSGKQEKVNQHPAGKEIVCYVNPEKPWQALLHRDLGWWALFALFPLPFLAVGFGGLWWLYKKRAKASVELSSSDALGRRTSSLRHEAGVRDAFHGGGSSSVSGEKTFSPSGSRVKGLLGILFFALFWNGIVSVFVTIAVKGWLAGNPEWFLMVFLIPFVLVGLGTMVFSMYSFLALFNPSPRITLKPGALTLGGSATLRWRIPSKAQRLKQFRLYLVGEEEAQYRRGTNTVTDTEVFFEQLLFETADPRQASRGELQCVVPVNTMPSWKSQHHEIKWSLVVKGDIALWPDINDTYALEVVAPDFTPQH
ncbi:DUF3592 domain-containing protein [Verrucomicrobiaceae bacterium N1E253]|uniref:DUF3592 domain-containing protein n=1 Tax=Oceaniferula marina TaxID=2748318 RepID=A0A851GJ14_9BACT|nr:DUF3592 domain-containing protein [Oceaniferula marina]NWK55107.1 DUF3592 domain-containing protein [Oceaniferula marina]